MVSKIEDNERKHLRASIFGLILQYPFRSFLFLCANFRNKLLLLLLSEFGSFFGGDVVKSITILDSGS